MIRLYNFSTALLSQLFTLGMLLNWFTVCIKLHNPFGADTGYDIALPSELEINLWKGSVMIWKQDMIKGKKAGEMGEIIEVKNYSEQEETD